ncbi:MAG: ABC transporter substrate-binding protein [Bryobacterales bacterium]|nr:ABC transporter substrate-binding protein [Bryobacterales bacterium]
MPRPPRDLPGILLWLGIAAVVIGAFTLAWRSVEPPPPRKIRIAAGAPGGSYHAFALRYAEWIAREGIELEVVATAGAVENLELLESGAVKLAFHQGGAASGSHQGLQTLGSVFFEPLWVFHRTRIPVTALYDLRGRRIACGPDGSGTQRLAMRLLEMNGIDSASATLLILTPADAEAALLSGEADAAMFVSGADAAFIRRLLGSDEVSLMDFGRSLAYQRRFHFLSRVTLPEGGIDLARNLPPGEKTLLAPAASLVAREDLHPALPPLLMQALVAVHERGDLFTPAGRFPSDSHAEFPMNRQARRFLRSGPGLLYQYLPYWAASAVDRLKILLLPLITLLIPLGRAAPHIYRWRVRSRIYRWYKVLRQVDTERETNIARSLERLGSVERELDQISVPPSYGEELYNLRMHADRLRARLEAKEPGG